MNLKSHLIPSYVYVDGFNLYYGAVKGTPFKWLDISKLCELMLPRNQMVKIKYFTALVNARPKDPGQPLRQQIYLRALKTIPNLEIVFGHFLTHIVNMPLANYLPGHQQFVQVIKTEEKGSDVNIATHLLHDGYQDAYEVSVIISNDSDLVEAIKIIRYELKKNVIVLNPFKDSPSQELNRYATFVKPIRMGVLAASQFPYEMVDRNGSFHKPKNW
jgi:uncharacterized LabA/DUF88 family protein